MEVEVIIDEAKRLFENIEIMQGELKQAYPLLHDILGVFNIIEFYGIENVDIEKVKELSDKIVLFLGG